MSNRKYQLRLQYDERRYYFGVVYDKSEQTKFNEKMTKFLDSEARSGEVISETGVILKSRFKINGIIFEITGTESTGPDIFDAIDTVHNRNTGKFKEYDRRKLRNLTTKK